MKKSKTIVTDHKKNFTTLTRAFKFDDVCLMDCVEKTSGEHIAVICATIFDGKDYAFTPFAKFFNGNPFDMLIPPGDPNYPKGSSAQANTN